MPSPFSTCTGQLIEKSRKTAKHVVDQPDFLFTPPRPPSLFLRYPQRRQQTSLEIGNILIAWRTLYFLRPFHVQGRCSPSFTVNLVPFGSSRIRLYYPRITPRRIVFHYAQLMVIPRRVWSLRMNAVRDSPGCRGFTTSLTLTSPFRVRRCGGYYQQRRYASRGNRLLHGVLRRSLASLRGCPEAAVVSLER